MAREQPARVETVLGEEDAPAERLTLVGRRLRPLRRGADLGRAVEQADARERADVDGQGERAALAREASHPQVAAQHAGEPLRDREPETRAPEAARGRGVRLREGGEEPRLLLGVEADAGVDDLEAETGVLHRTDLEAHAPPGRELDRVADQAQEYLGESGGVGLDRLREGAAMPGLDGAAHARGGRGTRRPPP